MAVTLEQIKELRSRTGAGVTAVKEALESSNGDIDKAVNYLREKGIAKAAKRADRSAANGFIAHYIHGDGNIAVLVELNSETDFTSRNEKFRKLANEIALHIAASKPMYVTVEDIPEDVLAQEKEIASKGVDTNKPANIVEKIIEGKLSKFYEETVLLKQKYVRDDSKAIEDLVNEAVAAIGEKIEIGRFCRFEIAAPSCAQVGEL
ncbi:translation elongation factor Ts [Candidatus Dojkabacteria bacterium]|uniref:Elongation factor Ts n=1 Tax=Candidatus Dojkabacteria bacterium TaxID=2099670 RepID=A0A955L6D4_9BACT|nr:translation elongation factor Ts [Candidatus Dojkabacteria bacterium]